MNKQVPHFWFMTIETPGVGASRVGSYQGLRTPRRGQTRLELFNSIRAEIEERDPLTRGGVVVGFDIQPNEM
ncbi:hypothetical protein [Streptomyces sp. NPDC093223]|uniref:hypothetical protein n=1 Tax=Streptomyces sp. NPDC093223 TaxID=3366033 RepID=UPI0037F5A384